MYVYIYIYIYIYEIYIYIYITNQVTNILTEVVLFGNHVTNFREHFYLLLKVCKI